MNNLDNPLITNPDELENLLTIEALQTHKSLDPLVKLKRNMRYSSVSALLITGGYVAAILAFPIWQVQLSMMVLIIFNVWMLSTGYVLYRDINLDAAQNSLLSQLKRIHSLFSRSLREQYKVAILVFPIAATGGFILGGVLGSGKTVEQFFSKPFVWWALVGCIAVLIPAGLWLTKTLNQAAYGKYLDEIADQIEALEKD
jgi:hypothetical protein